MLLDGDQVRHGLNGDLGFAPQDREENIRRVGEAANLFFRQGTIVLCTFVSPYQQDRDRARALMPEGRFFEVFVDAPLDVVEGRDPKGLYARARKGEIGQMTGISSPYEAPKDAEVHVHSDTGSVEQAVEQLMGVLGGAGVVPVKRAGDKS
jgi:bifunctional enzyme CysN/CysC